MNIEIILLFVVHLLIGIIFGYNLGFKKGRKKGKECGLNEAPILILKKSMENGYCVLCKQKIDSKN